MKLLGANRSNNTDSDEANREVKWIQERPNVWRVVYVDQHADTVS